MGKLCRSREADVDHRAVSPETACKKTHCSSLGKASTILLAASKSFSDLPLSPRKTYLG